MEYAVFGYLLVRACNSSPSNNSRRRIFARVMVIAIVFALRDEFHQLFVPGRSAELTDLGVDLAGLGFGHSQNVL